MSPLLKAQWLTVLMTSVTPLVSRGLETGCSRDAPFAWLQALSPQAREHPLPCPPVFTGTCSKQVRKYVICSHFLFKIYHEKDIPTFLICIDAISLCVKPFINSVIFTLEIEAKLPLSLSFRPTWFTWSLRPGYRCSLNSALASKCLLF